MGSIISAIYDDIEEYKSLCRRFGEKVRTTPDRWGNNTADCYGEHAASLKKKAFSRPLTVSESKTSVTEVVDDQDNTNVIRLPPLNHMHKVR